MAVYIRQTQGVHAVANDPAFHSTGYRPGSKPPHSGIYRCRGCNVEVVAEEGRTFPPSHDSEVAGHPVIWDLLVRTGHPSQAQRVLNLGM